MFGRAFGESALHALRREKPFSDFDGKVRYIDYALQTLHGRIAIELNGESFHHPRCIGIDRYCSQLFKQNSLVMSGWRVFRWSERGMRDADRFIEEMRRFFGPAEDFRRVPTYMAPRSVGTFQLMEHQEEALDRLSVERQAGRSSFLIELPTGTGKTEVFMEDFRREKARDRCLNGLIMVPTTETPGSDRRTSGSSRSGVEARDRLSGSSAGKRLHGPDLPAHDPPFPGLCIGCVWLRGRG